MKLVDNANQSWRWFSVQALALAGLWEVIKGQPDVLAVIPDYIEGWISLVLIIAAYLGRMVKQVEK